MHSVTTRYISGYKSVQIQGGIQWSSKTSSILLKPLLGSYKSNADLVMVLFEMITKTETNPEELDLKSPETLKSYANGKRRFQPDFARSLINNLDLENFIISINSNSYEVLERLSIL